MHPARYFIFIFSLLAFFAQAQKKGKALLEKQLTVTIEQQRLDLALKQIGDAGGFNFSYNPSIIETDRTVSYRFVKKTLREILDQIFRGSIEYKVRGSHIILTKPKGSAKVENDKILSGYVIDEATGERLENVSIYDPVTLTSAVTDSYGYFEMKLDSRKSEEIRLAINKQDYTDTLYVIPSGNKRLLNIQLKIDERIEKFKNIDKQKVVSKADTIAEKLKRFWNQKILQPRQPNLVNIRDTLHRKFQFSVVPFVGTNHLLSGNVVNDYSLNLFGGYNKGVQKFELGGLFNIDRGDVKNVQIAGLFNTNGGGVEGFQAAGLFNVNNGEVRGAQVGGLANINWNSISVFSAAGLINLTRQKSKGVHFAGVSNLTVGEQDGVHVAGVFNLASDNAGPVQLAGVFNLTAKNFEGVQAAGVFNLTGKSCFGTQLAGVFNFAGKDVNGTQIAPVFNFASHVTGSQVGLLNIADSVQGVSIGLFSFVMKGYHKLEFAADEIFYLNAAFRSGVHRFYNIFTAGAKPDSFAADQTYWTFGYGIGTAPRLTRWLHLNFDFTANQIMQERHIKRLNLLNKFFGGFEVQLVKGIAITMGVTLNAHLTNPSLDGYQSLFTDYQPKIIHNQRFGTSSELNAWWGAKAGIRFF